jgi:plastocyanin
MQPLRQLSLTAARLLAVVVLLLASFSVMPLPAQATNYTVKMGSDTGQLVFVPDVLNIKPGDTVEWVMNKVPPHNVMFDGDKIPGGDTDLANKLSHKQLLFATGEGYSSSFEGVQPGIYPYYCVPHRGAGMAGKIVVQE